MTMNNEQLAKLGRVKPPLKEAVMMAEITGLDVTVSRAGNAQLVVTLSPVINNAPQFALALRQYIPLPMESHENLSRVERAKVIGDLTKKGYKFLHSVDPEFPSYPKRQAQGVYQSSTGATLDYHAQLQAAIGVDVAVIEALTEINKVGNPAVEKYKGARVFMKPQAAKVDPDTGEIGQFVAWTSSEVRDGETILGSDANDTLIDEVKFEEALASMGLGA